MKYCCEKFEKYIYDIYRYDEDHPEKGWQFYHFDYAENPFDVERLYYCPFCGKKLESK